jgi:Tfp pilus assembly protein PilF
MKVANLNDKGNCKEKLSNQTDNIEEALTLGIDAVHRGDMKQATEILQWVLEMEPGNQVAWLWLACTVDDEVKKRECYIRSGSMR